MSKKTPIIVSLNTPEITIRFVETLLDEASAMLCRYGQSRATAETLSRRLVIGICRLLNGQLVYFGKNTLLEAQRRRQAIRDDFKAGETEKALAVKYQLSTRQIHSIIHEIKDTVTAKASTKGADFIAIAATRMFMRIGENSTDAASAARGLLAVISAKFGGNQFYVPKSDSISRLLRMIQVSRLKKAGHSLKTIAEHFNLTEEQIIEISNAYPATIRTIPDASALPEIRTRLNAIARDFNHHHDISDAINDITERINRVEKIINKLEVNHAD